MMQPRNTILSTLHQILLRLIYMMIPLRETTKEVVKAAPKTTYF